MDWPGGFSAVNLLPVLLLVWLPLFAIAQNQKNPDKVVIGDNRYILHTVQKSETLYSISRLYGCTQEEVLSNNKNVTGVIKKGMVLKIPDHSYQTPQSARVDENKFIQHQVVSGDNYYQLRLKYGVEEEELLKYNPELKDGLKTGKTILVPRKTRSETETRETPPEESQDKATSMARGNAGGDKVLNIGLYLPISASVSDSLRPTARTLSFLAFYQGALIAVDRLARSGVKTKMFVYDTEKANSKVESLVKKPEFLSLDLIIGPVYPDIQKTVSELSAKNRIPMVSPLTPDDKFTRSNPYFFQVNPVRKLRIDATADYISRDFRKEKLIFLETENGSQDTKLIRDQVTRRNISPGAPKGQFQVYNIWTKGIEELENQLKSDKPNIFVMAEPNEVNVSIAMNRLTLLSKKFPVVLIGIQEFTRMQSIETESLHNVGLRYLANSFVDYGLPRVTAFVEEFKTEFGTEPSIFAFQGYDVTTWFIQAIQKYGNLSKSLPAVSGSGLLQSNFHFTKVSEFGGYTNDNFTIIEYTNSFDVKSNGLISSN